jgi:hypothetical protein
MNGFTAALIEKPGLISRVFYACKYLLLMQCLGTRQDRSLRQRLQKYTQSQHWHRSRQALPKAAIF